MSLQVLIYKALNEIICKCARDEADFTFYYLCKKSIINAICISHDN